MRVLWLVAILCLAPLAAAATPAQASLSSPSGFVLEGTGTLSAASAGLDLVPSLATGVPFTLHWERASGWSVETRWTQALLPTGSNVTTEDGRDNRTLAFGPGALHDASCDPGARCEAFLFAPDDARIVLEGALRGPIEAASVVRSHWAAFADPSERDAFAWRIPEAALQWGDGAAGFDIESVRFEGTIGLLLHHADATLDADGGAHSLDTGEKRETLAGALPAARVTSRFVVLMLEGASLDAAPGLRATFSAAEPRVHMSGTLRSAEAHGWLRYGDARHDLDGDALRLDGELLLAPRSSLRAGVVPTESAFGYEATVEGDVDVVLLAGAPPPGPLPSAGSGLVAGTVLVGAAAFLLWLQGASFTPLYSRIGRHDALENDNRRVIFAAVRESPGCSIADLSRKLALPRVVVLHHLRVLETHRYVTRRPGNHRHAYFVAEASPEERVLAALQLLRVPARRRIAEAIANAALPLTQRDLEHATGSSQRLVSHHVRTLLEAGLLCEDEGRPRRYLAAPTLVAALAPADGSPFEALSSEAA